MREKSSNHKLFTCPVLPLLIHSSGVLERNEMHLVLTRQAKHNTVVGQDGTGQSRSDV